MCPAWIKGLLSVGLIAIIMGMSDGILHATSVIFANDVVKVLRPQTSEKSLIYCAKGGIAALSCVALALASLSGDTIGLIWSMHSLWFPIVVVPLYAGFYGFVAEKESFMVSMIVAIPIVAFGYYVKLEPTTIFVAGVLGSIIGFFGSHILIQGS